MDFHLFEGGGARAVRLHLKQVVLRHRLQAPRPLGCARCLSTWATRHIADSRRRGHLADASCAADAAVWRAQHPVHTAVSSRRGRLSRPCRRGRRMGRLRRNRRQLRVVLLVRRLLPPWLALSRRHSRHGCSSA